MRSLLCLLLLLLAPTTAPAPAPDATKVENLILKLADNDFKIRESATSELIALGPRILPFLRAHKADDPEIRHRLQLIIDKLHTIAHAPRPSAAIPTLIAHLNGDAQCLLSARNSAPGQVEVSMSFKQDKVVMTRSAGGIQIQAEVVIDGKHSRETYRAETEAELKVHFPKAWELHELLLTSTYGEERRWWRQFVPQGRAP